MQIAALKVEVKSARMTTSPFVASGPWKQQRPSALVIACSDGRLQENLDDFLSNALRITQYDRLYVPGGPGALAISGLEMLRPEQVRRELHVPGHARTRSKTS